MAFVLAIGLGLLLWRGAQTEELDAVRPGILADAPLVKLLPGHESCQGPLDLDRPVRQMGLAVDTLGKPGPPLEIEVRDNPTGRVLARATVPAGYVVGLGAFEPVTLDPALPDDASVDVCARNAGAEPLTLVGKQSIATSALHEDSGRTIQEDWAIFFPLAPQDRRSLLATTPDILARASVLRPGIVTPAFYVVLGLLLVVGGPLLLWRAVRLADEPDG
jgi:hypothetical protein